MCDVTTSSRREICVPQRFQVMKDWSDLEERYQDIRARDPVAADAFKRWMTVRFQQTVAALEASGAAEKHHLSAMHQQRVQVRVCVRVCVCVSV